MKNKLFTVLFVIIFILNLFLGVVKPVLAQGITDQIDIPLLQINPSEIQLAGPYGSSTQTFGLPVSWNLSPGAKLLLNMTVSFNSGAIAGQPVTTTQAQGGTLSIRFNGVSVGILSLNQVGEVSQTLELPPSSLVSQRADGRMELYFSLDSGSSCYFNQRMLVIIHSNSILSLPHSFITPDVSLLNFPRPLNIDSILTESAIVVVPDQPTSAELQAALTVSAGLGSQTGTILALDIETVSSLSQEQTASNQLIIVGKSSSLSILKVLQLPFSVDSGQFLMEIGGEDNGVVQLVISPWNPGKVILLVSGNTDVGVIKAAQAISTGILRPNAYPNLSIVQKVQSEQ